MLSRETQQKVRQHLRLAKGMLQTAVVGPESSEFDERNALSRAYYAMFHGCCAWLACNYGIVRQLKHFEVLDEMHRRRGRQFGDFVRDLRGMREAADYREEWRPRCRVTQDRLAKVESVIGRLEAEIEAELIQ
jgi:uncharacterized protein (UPF0332 family)